MDNTITTSNTNTNTKSNTNTRRSDHRARWAAIGAALAVSVGAGGIGLVGAASPAGSSMFVGTDPCRIVDTRSNPEFHVGPHGTLGPDSTITVTASGNVGECTGPTAIPAAASGLQLNVTALGATLPTHFTIFPGSGTPPNASSLNPVPGQPPIPNAVTVELDDSNQFSIYNLQGSVEVVVDVVGYFTDDFEIASQDISNESGVASSDLEGSAPLNGGDQTVVSTSIRVPSDGYLVLHASGQWYPQHANQDLGRCQLSMGTTFDGNAPFITLNDLGAGNVGQLSFSGHRTVPVTAAANPPAAGEGQDVNLVCATTLGTSSIEKAHLTAQFVPTSYEEGSIEISG